MALLDEKCTISFAGFGYWLTTSSFSIIPTESKSLLQLRVSVDNQIPVETQTDETISKISPLEFFNIEKLSTHGGSLRYYIKRIVNKKIKVKKSVQNQLTDEIKFGLNNYNTYKKFGKAVYKSKKNLIGKNIKQQMNCIVKHPQRMLKILQDF